MTMLFYHTIVLKGGLDTWGRLLHADGHLGQNLQAIGLEPFLREQHVRSKSMSSDVKRFKCGSRIFQHHLHHAEHSRRN